MSTEPQMPTQNGSVQQSDPGMTAAMDSWGDGDGGQVAAPSASASPQQQAPAAPVPSRPASAEPTTQPATQPSGSVAPAAGLDPAKLIEAAVNSTAAAFQRTQQANAPKPEPKPMSDAEFEARYGIVKYDAKTLERLFDKDPAKAAQVLNEIQQNAYQAAVRMANDLVQGEVQKAMAQAKGTYDPRISQMEAFISEQREAAATNKFYTSYPDLKEEEPMVKEILAAVNDRVAKGTLKFANESEAFKFVADATNSRIAQMRERYGGGVAPAANGGGRPSGQQIQQGRQMATASSSARPGGAPPKKPSDMDAMMSAWDERERPD